MIDKETAQLTHNREIYQHPKYKVIFARTLYICLYLLIILGKYNSF